MSALVFGEVDPRVFVACASCGHAFGDHEGHACRHPDDSEPDLACDCWGYRFAEEVEP